MLLLRHAGQHLPLPVLFFLTLFALAGCGGGGSDSAGPGPQTANAGDPEAPAPTTPPAPEPEPDPQPEPVNLTWDAPYERPEEYPGTVDLPQQLITLRDGIRLSATVTLPADENGEPADGPFPVVATFTGYNQFLGAIGAADPYLVKRGYAYILSLIHI